MCREKRPQKEVVGRLPPKQHRRGLKTALPFMKQTRWKRGRRGGGGEGGCRQLRGEGRDGREGGFRGRGETGSTAVTAAPQRAGALLDQENIAANNNLLALLLGQESYSEGAEAESGAEGRDGIGSEVLSLASDSSGSLDCEDAKVVPSGRVAIAGQESKALVRELNEIFRCPISKVLPTFHPIF